MLERGRGKIIFVASLLSFQGGINVPGYAASKGGVAQLTKALANEWAPRGVNVNAIAPGYIDTDNTQALRDDPTRSRQILERIPAGRWGGPEDVAGAAVFLASAAADYVHGVVLPGRRRLARAVSALPAAARARPRGRGAERAGRRDGRGRMPCARTRVVSAAPSHASAPTPERADRRGDRVSQIDGFVVGAGTVLTAEQARRAHDAGAGARSRAPGDGRSRWIDACRELGLPFVPGRRHGDRDRPLRKTSAAPVVKLFPASLLGGPPFVAAMSAVYPDVRVHADRRRRAPRRCAPTSTSRPCSPAAEAGRAPHGQSSGSGSSRSLQHASTTG